MSFINKLFELDNSEIIYGLTDELKCIYISQRYKKLDKSILIVLNTLYEANKLYQALSNYIDDVYLFPMDDFLTSEALAMSPELKTTRLETLENIIKNKKNIVITNLMGYLRYLPPKESYKQSFITCKTNDEIECFAQNLLNNIREARISFQYSPIVPQITISFGAVNAKVEDNLDILDFVYNADKVLYKVKEKGRNNYMVIEME